MRKIMALSLLLTFCLVFTGCENKEVKEDIYNIEAKGDKESNLLFADFIGEYEDDTYNNIKISSENDVVFDIYRLTTIECDSASIQNDKLVCVGKCTADYSRIVLTVSKESEKDINVLVSESDWRLLPAGDNFDLKYLEKVNE